MGIALNAVYLLMQVTKDSDRTLDQQVLTLGVQDCYFTREDLECFLKRHGFPCESPSDSDIEYTSGFRHLGPDDRQRLAKNLHQRTLFRFLGYDPKRVLSLDVTDLEGCDIIHDLNTPVPSSLHSKFDLVLDAGTIEHVFSLKDAFFNMARMCRLGGLTIHFAPVDMVNHGFVNLNATVFKDFYESNGFERVYLQYIAIPTDETEASRHFLELDPFFLREPLRAPYYLAAFATYRKVRECKLEIPLQEFYRELIGKSEAASLTGHAQSNREISSLQAEQTGGHSLLAWAGRAIRARFQPNVSRKPPLPPHRRIIL
jgi:hypothetical protein